MGPSSMLVWVAVAITGLGCGSPEDPAPARGRSTSAETAPAVGDSAECHAELESIARCLHAAVSELQQEPESTDTIAAFLGHAAGAVASSDMPDPCAPLGLTEESDEIMLSDGSHVRATRSEDIDELEDGLTVVHILYRFESPTCARAAETTLEHQMGGGH